MQTTEKCELTNASLNKKREAREIQEKSRERWEDSGKKGELYQDVCERERGHMDRKMKGYR